MCPLLPSDLAGSGSQEEGASLTLTGGNTAGEGEREEEGEGERERHNARISDGVCCATPSSTVTVVIDAYTHNSTITSGDSVPLGTQLILVCQVVSLPYGTKLCFTSGQTLTSPLTFTWKCPDGLCFTAQLKSRSSYQNNFILAITTISTTYSGTYTCQVADASGQKAKGSFTLNIAGKHHSVCSTKCVHEWHTTLMALLQQMDPLILLPTNSIYHICTHFHRWSCCPQ